MDNPNLGPEREAALQLVEAALSVAESRYTSLAIYLLRVNRAERPTIADYEAANLAQIKAAIALDGVAVALTALSQAGMRDRAREIGDGLAARLQKAVEHGESLLVDSAT